MNSTNNKRLHALLGKSGMMDCKKELVETFTSGRTEHSSAMGDDEVQKLIAYLEGYATTQQTDNVADRLRKRVISKFREMDYNKDGADMDRIQATVKKHWHKELNEYTVEELRKIVGVLERQWVPFYNEKKKEQQA